MITVINWVAELSVAAMASELMTHAATAAIISHGPLSVVHGTVAVVLPLPFGSGAREGGMATSCVSWFSPGRAGLFAKLLGRAPSLVLSPRFYGTALTNERPKSVFCAAR